MGLYGNMFDKRLKNKPEQLLCVVTDKGLDCIYDVKFN